MLLEKKRGVLINTKALVYRPVNDIDSKNPIKCANEWKYLLAIHKFGIEEICTKLNILSQEYELLHDYNPIEHIKSRVKTPQKIAQKLMKKGYCVTPANAKQYITDIGGVRIVCSFIDDIYMIYKNLSDQEDITIITIKDYIKNPKGNGYRSLHLLVSVPVFLSEKTEDVIIEVQIRTVAMDFWASSEHRIYYKTNKNVPLHVLAELKECAQIASVLDKKMQSIKKQIELQD